MDRIGAIKQGLPKLLSYTDQNVTKLYVPWPVWFIAHARLSYSFELLCDALFCSILSTLQARPRERYSIIVWWRSSKFSHHSRTWRKCTETRRLLMLYWLDCLKLLVLLFRSASVTGFGLQFRDSVIYWRMIFLNPASDFTYCSTNLEIPHPGLEYAQRWLVLLCVAFHLEILNTSLMFGFCPAGFV